MISSPSAPVAPDPAKTAAAQAGMNIDTAQAQQLTNQVDQVTPQGTLTYTQNGTKSFVDSNGKTVTIPNYVATTIYSPDQQALYDLGNQTQQKIGQIGLQQAGKIGDLLGTPVDLSNDATESRLYELGSKRLDPQFAQQEDALRTRLSNQGLTPGSAAWDAEMTKFQQGRNDAYDQLLLQGHAQATQEALAQRNQPINEISALLSGSQVSQPNFIGTPQSSIASPDYMGAVQNQYNSQLAAYNQRLTSNNAMLGGLFGLVGTLGGAGITKWSDRRLKRDIRRIGALDNGLPVYAYRYVWGGPTEIGLMADEVQRVNPDAVSEHAGFKAVDYALATEAAA